VAAYPLPTRTAKTDGGEGRASPRMTCRRDMNVHVSTVGDNHFFIIVVVLLGIGESGDRRCFLVLVS
jgi:hypothetical protein